MDAQMKKGVLEMCILYKLKDEELYGYEIMRSIRQIFPDVYEGSIYTILRRLNATGHTQITQKKSLNGPARKYYGITQKPNEDNFSPMIVIGIIYTEKAEAGKAILEACKKMTNPEPKIIGEYRGFTMELSFDSFSREYKLSLKYELSHSVALGSDVHGNITRFDNALEGFETKMQACEEHLE